MAPPWKSHRISMPHCNHNQIAAICSLTFACLTLHKGKGIPIRPHTLRMSLTQACVPAFSGPTARPTIDRVTPACALCAGYARYLQLGRYLPSHSEADAIATDGGTAFLHACLLYTQRGLHQALAPVVRTSTHVTTATLEEVVSTCLHLNASATADCCPTSW